MGVVVQDLKRPMKKSVFQCWLGDEAKLLRKFGGLNFYDQDTNFTYTVHTVNMVLGHRHGYTALGVKEGDRPEDPAAPFWLELLASLSGDNLCIVESRYARNLVGDRCARY